MLIYLSSLQIAITAIICIIFWIFLRSYEFNKILTVFCINFIIFQISIIFIDKYQNYLFHILFSVFIIFILSCLYILIFFSIKLSKIISAFNRLANNDSSVNIKPRGNFKSLIYSYLTINKNYSSIVSAIELFSQDLTAIMSRLNETSENVKKGINIQESITNNFNTALDILGKSIEAGAKGLDETRIMFKNNVENFNILFDNINTIFDQNKEMQKENKNMEKFSISAIQFSLDLNEITKEGTKKIDMIIGFIEDFVKSVKKIVEMINLIKKISHQTNMLAINASIEAAHAGQKGQGFAVVADEIRILSESSSEVTSKITDIVKVISKELEEDQKHSKNAKEGIEAINTAFSKNINFINLLADSINEQIESVDRMKEMIERIHTLSKNIKDSNDIQQRTTQEIYEATEILNSQSFLISQLVIQQKSILDNIIVSLDRLDKLIKDTTNYSTLLPEIIKNFKN
jgi:methyl-accepting chemotaxis protein